VRLSRPSRGRRIPARGRRGLRSLALPALSAAAFGVCVSPASATPALSDGHGLQIQAVHQLDPRLLEVTVATAALPGPANVRILLPAGYEAHPTRRYPVLYLFHGTTAAQPTGQ
jgi:hypothetical protein